MHSIETDPNSLCLQEVVERVAYPDAETLYIDWVRGEKPQTVSAPDARVLLHAQQEKGRRTFTCQVEGCTRTFDLMRWRGFILNKTPASDVSTEQCLLRAKTDMPSHQTETDDSSMKEIAMGGSVLTTAADAARYLNIHPNTLRRWANQGFLQVSILPSGVRRYPIEEIKRLKREMYQAFESDDPGSAAPNES